MVIRNDCLKDVFRMRINLSVNNYRYGRRHLLDMPGWHAGSFGNTDALRVVGVDYIVSEDMFFMVINDSNYHDRMIGELK